MLSAENEKVGAGLAITRLFKIQEHKNHDARPVT